MRYVIQFEYASFIICAIIQILFFTRNSFVTRSSRIFFALLTCCMLTTVFDIASAYTIMDPTLVPLWLNYILSAGYIVCYCSNAFLYLLYLDSITKIPSVEKIVNRAVFGLIAYELILFITTPFTGALIYFDENLVYNHGPLFYFNYFLCILAMLVGLALVFKGRVRISEYQKILVLGFVISVFIAIGYQVYRPDVLLGGFIITLSTLYIYICFENPAFSFYLDTRCHNRALFNIVIKSKMRHKRRFGLVVAKIKDYQKYEKMLSRTESENLSRAIAERVARNFKKSSFMVLKYAFVIIVNPSGNEYENEKQIQKTLAQIFENELILAHRRMNVEVLSDIIPSEYSFDSLDDLDKVIMALISKEDDASSDIDREEVYKKVDGIINAIKRREDVVKAVERGIQKESFKVFYQPIYNVKTNKFASSEALVRLIDDELGFISPDEFIPIAEEKGLIIPIGELVFKKVCEFISSVDREALGIDYVEVNLSPIQCADPAISPTLFRIMGETGTSPELINFEITETAETEFNEDSIIVNNIIEMSKKGLKFSVDDFGSGFAAMDYLFKLPVDLVKVDRSILWQAMKNSNAMIVLKNTFNMVKDLNMEILVEGVETEEMVELLKSYGCNYMQGFYFSKPVPENEYIEFLKANN